MTIFPTETNPEMIINVNKILAIAKINDTGIEVIFHNHEEHLPLYYKNSTERDLWFKELASRMRQAQPV